MSRFPPCTRAQQGYSCYCPTCVMYNPGTAPRPELPQAGVSSSDRPPVYAGDTQTYSRGHDYGNDFSGSSVPMAPLGGSRLLGGHTGGNMDGLQPWAANPFSVINTGYQQPGPGSLGNFLDGARGSAGLDELSSQLGQQGNMATPELSPEPDAQPAKTRVKRKSKYNNEPPHSVYGPPFETKNITAGLSQDEIRARTQYNESVEEARKVYLRWKNNVSAKKSRERKQSLIDELTAEKQRLKKRLQQIEVTNLQLANTAARLHTAENDNDRLRRENELLRQRVDDLTRRIGVLERERDADWANAMLMPPAQPLGEPQNPQPQQYQERQRPVSGGGAPTANAGVEMDQFFNDVNNSGGNGSFGWDGSHGLP